MSTSINTRIQASLDKEERLVNLFINTGDEEFLVAAAEESRNANDLLDVLQDSSWLDFNDAEQLEEDRLDALQDQWSWDEEPCPGPQANCVECGVEMESTWPLLPVCNDCCSDFVGADEEESPEDFLWNDDDDLYMFIEAQGGDLNLLPPWV